MSCELLNSAVVPIPFTNPGTPVGLPAKVVTWPYIVAGTAPPLFLGLIVNGMVPVTFTLFPLP